MLRSGGRAGRLKVIPPPHVPGMDVAGVVDQVGDPAGAGLRPGDHVMAIVVPLGSHGGYAEQAAEAHRRLEAGSVRGRLVLQF